MKVTLNGTETQLHSPYTVADLLAAQKLADHPAAVEVNGNVVPKAEHDTHQLRDGDRIEIVTLVGGG